MNSAPLKVATPAQSIRVALGSALAQLQVGDGDRRHADRDVEVEDRLPAEAVGEGAADQRPDRHRDPDRGTVDPHRGAALAAGRELLGDQRQRDREHHRAADALQAAGEVEEGRVGRQRAEQRGDREDREAEGEDAPAAEPVGERAGGQQEHRERQDVGVDDPLEVGEARVERRTQVGQRHVHDGQVEHEHEGRERHDPERPPAGARGGRGRCGSLLGGHGTPIIVVSYYR